MNWQEVVQSIATHSGSDAFWLICHASYLMHTNHLLWGVDLRLNDEMHAEADQTIAKDLSGLRVAMTTHLHSDHYDTRLIQLLSEADIHWIFPAFTPPDEQARLKTLLPSCSFVQAGDTLNIRGLQIEVFPSNHYDVFHGERIGVPEIGYRVTSGNRRYLFPGDIRTYTSFPAELRQADELFAHVWLGRQAALSPAGDMIDAFCRFFLSAHASRIWLGHLNDTDRLPNDRWTDEHAQTITARMHQLSPGQCIRTPDRGVKNVL